MSGAVLVSPMRWKNLIETRGAAPFILDVAPKSALGNQVRRRRHTPHPPHPAAAAPLAGGWLDSLSHPLSALPCAQPPIGRSRIAL